jgi:hypothetical protein
VLTRAPNDYDDATEKEDGSDILVYALLQHILVRTPDKAEYRIQSVQACIK